MRTVVFAALIVAGVGLLGVSGASAVPADGVAIGKTAAAGDVIQQAQYWRHRHWRHRYYRRHHRW